MHQKGNGFRVEGGQGAADEYAQPLFHLFFHLRLKRGVERRAHPHLNLAHHRFTGRRQAFFQPCQAGFRRRQLGLQLQPLGVQFIEPATGQKIVKEVAEEKPQDKAGQRPYQARHQLFTSPATKRQARWAPRKAASM
ncbi:hypothetical protein kuro4_27440 [Gelria sp. Kuro-4]|nr:hypothetical protein kuro4_27440 [Gelria sp. Kuro-4]